MYYDPNFDRETLYEEARAAIMKVAEREWTSTPVVQCVIWRWAERDYVTLVAYVNDVCRSGVRVPMPRQEWR